MKLLNLSLDGTHCRYLLAHDHELSGSLELSATSTTDVFESVASSRFFLSKNNKILAKVVPDKFNRTHQTLKWLGRDYMEKRWLFQFDARKEYHCGRILQRLGLSTPQYYGWGVSLNPFNPNASLLLMEHLQHARPSSEVFATLDHQQRLAFLNTLCQDIAQIVRHGYTLRDLHYNNLLVANDNKLIWIDTHLRRLPQHPSKRWAAIKRSMSASKLGGDIYRQHVLHQLSVLLDTDKT
ncbi:hypothetical protein [Halomonas halocynthiae]|uniref:hypothetical protein n=1 Tax=Halomonas halocynthiae TaxID=176290 RepID=UPI0003F58F6D|nr:hypothetical protein [Halomonas halocynthiae]